MSPGNEARAEGPRPNLPTIRAQLLRLVAACVLPGLLGAPFLVRFLYRHDRLALEASLVQTSRALSQALDRELDVVRASAEALAGSTPFARDDLADMYRHATESASSGLISNFVLSAPSGQQLFNTLRPYGSPLPFHGNLGQLRRVFETGAPVVSDIYQGGLLRRPVMSVDVPVRRGGKVAYDLSAGFFPEKLGEILERQQLPEGWVGTILDAQGTIAARTHLPDRFVGKKGTPEVLESLAKRDEGVVKASTVETVPSHIAFSRAPASRWTVAIAAPTSALMAQVREFIGIFSMGALLLLGIGVALTWALAGRLTRSVQSLVAPARALGTGDPVTVPGGALFREADEVARTLVTASRIIQQRTEERDRAQVSERASRLMAEERKRHGEHLQAALSENERLVAELRVALQNVKTLSGLLPICAWCHRIRDDAGYWQRLETYLSQTTEARFSHGMCPECARKMDPEGSWPGGDDDVQT